MFEGQLARVLTDPRVGTRQDVETSWAAIKPFWQSFSDFWYGTHPKEIEFFFAELPKWLENVNKHRDCYIQFFHGVICLDRPRANLDAVGAVLAETATYIEKVERLWKGTPPNVRLENFGCEKTIWPQLLEVKSYGYQHQRVLQLEKVMHCQMPLRLLGEFFAKSDEGMTSELQKWVRIADSWLHGTSDVDAFDLFHRVLCDVVRCIEDLSNKGQALGKFYCAFEEINLSIKDLRSKRQEQWVAQLTSGKGIVGTELILGDKRDNTTFATDSHEGEILEIHPNNPAAFLAAMCQRLPGEQGWKGLSVSVSYLDPLGRFAIVQSSGEPASERNEPFDEEGLQKFIKFFQEFLTGAVQPSGFKPEEHVRLVGVHTFRLAVPSTDKEELDAAALEDYFWDIVCICEEGSDARVRLQRRLMKDTGLAVHPQAETARLQHSARDQKQLTDVVNEVARELNRFYALRAMNAQAITQQVLCDCLKEKAFAITRVPHDFTALLKEHVVTKYKLQKKPQTPKSK